MKKDIEWAKNRIKNTLKFEALNDREVGFKIAMKEALELINQLDEPEVLSQEWIDEHKVSRINNLRKMTMSDVVPVEDLQNLIVTKQEELETKIQELIESYKREEDAYSNPENGWISGFIEDLKNLVEKEQKYYILGKYDTPILFRDHRNRITETSNLSEIYPKANSEDFEFTEQEIKDYDPRYWAFAETGGISVETLKLELVDDKYKLSKKTNNTWNFMMLNESELKHILQLIEQEVTK